MAQHEGQASSIDLAFLAYILEKVSPVCDRTKVQGAVFLVEFRLIQHSLVGPHFRFYRDKNGPFSRELADALGVFVARGIAAKHTLELTKRGQLLAEFVNEIGKETRNQNAFAIMNEAVAACGPEPGERLMRKIYDLDVRPEGRRCAAKIRNIPIGADLIVPSGTDIHVPEDLAWIITEELKLSDAEIEEARKQWPQWGRGAVSRLLDAIDDSPEPSAEIRQR